MSDDYITVAEAAEIAGVTEHMIREALRLGELEGHKVGNQWFIDRDDLEEWLEVVTSDEYEEEE